MVVYCAANIHFVNKPEVVNLSSGTTALSVDAGELKATLASASCRISLPMKPRAQSSAKEEVVTFIE